MQDRAQAVKILYQVMMKGKSVSELKQQFKAPYARHLAYGVLRYFESLQSIANQLLKKPLSDQQLNLLLLVGLYQLIHDDTPVYAAINSTVSATSALKKSWGRAVINYALRQYTRTPLKADETKICQYNQPAWLVDRIEKAWPQQASSIFEIQLCQAPLDLRVNTSLVSVDVMRDTLRRDGIIATPIPHTLAGLRLDKAQSIETIPGYQAGWFWVQDASGQVVVDLIELSPDSQILDACAAPGSKTASLLSRLPERSVLTAVDCDQERLRRLKENSQRLKLSAQFLHLDCAQIDSQFPPEYFDIILCDAPCSATGVIRRHPDIPYLRRDSDIDALCHTQKEILDALWRALKPSGVMVYTTCSIFPEENEQQVISFLKRHVDAQYQIITVPDAVAGVNFGSQRHPSLSHDGFYVACFKKTKSS